MKRLRAEKREKVGRAEAERREEDRRTHAKIWGTRLTDDTTHTSPERHRVVPTSVQARNAQAKGNSLDSLSLHITSRLLQ